jgi:hypothetical protein
MPVGFTHFESFEVGGTPLVAGLRGREQSIKDVGINAGVKWRRLIGSVPQQPLLKQPRLSLFDPYQLIFRSDSRSIPTIQNQV